MSDLVGVAVVAILAIGVLAALVWRPPRGRRRSVDEALASEALRREQDRQLTEAVYQGDKLGIKATSWAFAVSATRRGTDVGYGAGQGRLGPEFEELGRQKERARAAEREQAVLVADAKDQPTSAGPRLSMVRRLLRAIGLVSRN